MCPLVLNEAQQLAAAHELCEGRLQRNVMHYPFPINLLISHHTDVLYMQIRP